MAREGQPSPQVFQFTLFHSRSGIATERLRVVLRLCNVAYILIYAQGADKPSWAREEEWGAHAAQGWNQKLNGMEQNAGSWNV